MSTVRFLSGVVLFVSLVSSTRSQTWSPSPEPALTPACVSVGPTVNAEKIECVQLNATIVVVENDEIPLCATSQDFDTFTPASGKAVTVEDKNYTNDPKDPGPTVVWTCNGGEIKTEKGSNRVSSGTMVRWKAPSVDMGKTEGSATITARADDGTTGFPGRRPANQMGTMDDLDGPEFTILVKIIKASALPTITIAQSCKIPSNGASYEDKIWSVTKARSFGYLLATMQVGGGTPPTSPGNWNGLVIREEVAVHPTAALTTMKDNDFNAPPAPPPGQNPIPQPVVASYCIGASVWAVGSGGTSYDVACPVVPANNRFYDTHGSTDQWSTAKAGVTGKTIACQQKYFCGSTQLTPATFTITQTFTAGTYTPMGGAAQPVTEIPVTKATP